MKKWITTQVMLLLTVAASAQVSYELDTSVVVREDGVSLPFAWGGGLNAAEYNTMDLDGDGDDDLVLFDRMAGKVITWLNAEGRAVHAPDYEYFFPEEIESWLLLRDFDCDGRKDIFTRSVFGIVVFRNVSAGTSVTWERFYFFDGNSRSDVLLTKGLSGEMVNLQMQTDDLPSITDVDGDGDLDILAFNFGGNRIGFHRNYSRERLNSCEALDFELEDPFWGGVSECSCGVFAFNNEDCPAGGRSKHAGGKSLLAIDANGDGALDILVSEADCDRLFLLANQGTTPVPVFTGAVHYPPANPAVFDFYPTPFYEDADFDGTRDLLVSTGLFSRPGPTVDLRRSSWLYRNTGANDDPVLTDPPARGFLQQQMVDVGDNAVPAFADADGDGDQDLFVSNNEQPATVCLYENTGTPLLPSFERADENYLDFAAANFRNLRIQFADMNADGAPDLVFTATLASTGFSELFVLYNKARGRLDFSGQVRQRIEFTFAGADHLSLVDVNGDSRPDILRGRSNGALEYWRNTGNNAFALAEPQFLGYGASVVRTGIGCSVADVDLDGRADLLLGDQTGQLKVVLDFRAPQPRQEVSDLVLNGVTGGNTAPNLGGRIWPVAANLFGRGYPAIVAGTSMGGVRLLRPATSPPASAAVVLHPNPLARHETQLRIEGEGIEHIEVYTSSGQFVAALDARKAAYDVRSFAAGVYIVRIRALNKLSVHRLVVY